MNSVHWGTTHKYHQKEINYTRAVLAALSGNDADEQDVCFMSWWNAICEEEARFLFFTSFIVISDIHTLVVHLLECGVLLLVRYWM